MNCITRLVSVVAAMSFDLALRAGIAPNPTGAGPPVTANLNGVSCGSTNALTNGFGTSGFANATTHYAASPGTGSLKFGNTHAISP